MNELVERVAGRSGELVLRRRAGHLEVILNGAFLISSENEASSRALVTTGLDVVTGDGVDVLIGGLGLGYALDEALASPRVGALTVVEYEPTVVRWFEQYGEGRAAAACAAAARPDSATTRPDSGIARPDPASTRFGLGTACAVIVVADVVDVLRARQGAFDLVCLDTDNGPGWLVREANAGLYDEAGVRLAHDALRPGGAVVFWSTQRYPDFEARLRAVFGEVTAAGAHDVVAGRRHDYVMYVARRVD